MADLVIPSVEELVENLVERLSIEGVAMLAILDEEQDMINKTHLSDLTNKAYAEYNAGENLFKSRVHLDLQTARLEGAGLVISKMVGRTHFYTISPIGRIVLAAYHNVNNH